MISQASLNATKYIVTYFKALRHLNRELWFFTDAKFCIFYRYYYLHKRNLLPTQSLLWAPISTTFHIILFHVQFYITPCYISVCVHYRQHRDSGSQVRNYVMPSTSSYAKTFMTSFAAVDTTLLQCTMPILMRTIHIWVDSILTFTLTTR